MVILLLVILTYLITSLFGYVVHWSLHQSWAGSFNKAHMAHHLKLYPPNDFTSDVYRHAGSDNTFRTFAIASIPMVLIPILLGIFGILSWKLVLLILTIEGLVGYFNNYFHDSFHINNHFLIRIPLVKYIFIRLIHLHYLHHVDMMKNYGIFAFHWDRLFKTFWSN